MCGNLCANLMKCRFGHEHRMSVLSQENEGVFHTMASVDGGVGLKNTEVLIGVQYIRQRNSAV